MAREDDPDRPRRICAAALELDPEERDEYLDRVCRSDQDLRAKVGTLLKEAAVDGREMVDWSPIPTGTPDDPVEDVDGRRIGPYILRRELGRGGMGVVYLADDTRLSRRVALKALSASLDKALGGRDRLRREALAAAGLSHPGIATVYALEEFDHQLYLACEFVPGEPLRALLEFGAVPFSQVVSIGLQLARALAAARAVGVVHRDIKPENVVKTPSGVVKVLDFGLARLEGDAHPRLTQTGVIVGTPAYLAPEQALGKSVDFRTDIFALGLVIYELASGINPFAAATVTATIARIIETEPAPLSRRVSHQHLPELARIVATCLRKNPLDRYRSTEELVAELGALEARLAALRQRQSDLRDQTLTPMSLHGSQSRALWWWQFHQVVISAVYTLMIYPTWYIQRSLGQRTGMLFLLAVLGTAAWATSLRLHLWFMARQETSELGAQRARTLRSLQLADGGFAMSQLAGAVAIGSEHPEFAMLFVTVGIVALVGSLVIEPATARGAFGDQVGRPM